MHNAAADHLAKTVIALRRSAGMNQRQLATALGREQSYIGRIETGQRRVDLIEWIQILRAVGANPEREIVEMVREVMPLVAKSRGHS